MKKSEDDLKAEVRRLRMENAGLKSEVNLWRTRYFELASGTRPNKNVGLKMDEILSGHPAIRASIEAADREYRKQGGVPLEWIIRDLELRGERIPREVRMEVLRKSGREIRAHLEKRGLTEEKILAEFEAWRKARRAHRPRK